MDSSFGQLIVQFLQPASSFLDGNYNSNYSYLSKAKSFKTRIKSDNNGAVWDLYIAKHMNTSNKLSINIFITTLSVLKTIGRRIGDGS